MRLVKRLIELAFVIFVISLFMKNKDIVMDISYFGFSEPIRVHFWELVTFCVALGIIIAALGDFITQLKWVRERRRMVKNDREYQGVVDGLNEQIETLETENKQLKKDLEEKTGEIERLKQIEAAPAPLGEDDERPTEAAEPAQS